NQWDLLSVLEIPPPSPSAYPVEMPVDGAVAVSVADRLARTDCGGAARPIVVHVSAGNPFRRWPEESFTSLVRSLAMVDAGRRIVVTSGPSDGEAAGRVIAGARAALGPARQAQVVSCGDFSLAELRALLDRAALYIGGDSGPLHVAATTTVPIVG